MGPAQLWKRAVALLATAGLSAFLMAGSSADDGNTEAVAEATLQTTQIRRGIPQDEYGAIFQIQWGGGSLHQLKAQLEEEWRGGPEWFYEHVKSLCRL